MSQSQPADPLPALVQDADRLTLNQRVHRGVMRKPLLSQDDMRAAWEESERHDTSYGECGNLFFRRVAHRIIGGEPRYEQEIPKYSKDWSAIRLVEDEIERRGLGMRYLAALCRLVLTSDEMDDREWADREVLKVFRASCEQRCKAALSVCGALHDKRTDANA